MYYNPQSILVSFPIYIYVMVFADHNILLLACQRQCYILFVTCDFVDVHALSPHVYGPRASGIPIRQIIHVYVTTIGYIY